MDIQGPPSLGVYRGGGDLIIKKVLLLYKEQVNEFWFQQSEFLEHSKEVVSKGKVGQSDEGSTQRLSKQPEGKGKGL